MRRTNWQIFYAVDMGIACALSYAAITQILVRFVDEPTKLLGGMWAVVATVFVFRETRASTLSAGIERLVATCVSFALCLVYLLLFPVTGAVPAVLLNGVFLLTLPLLLHTIRFFEEEELDRVRVYTRALVRRVRLPL